MKITEEDSLCFLPNISNPAILFVFITAVREVWYQGLRDSHVGMVTSLSLNTCQNRFITVFLFYGARFSKVPVTLRARKQIFKSKYKE